MGSWLTLNLKVVRGMKEYTNSKFKRSWTRKHHVTLGMSVQSSKVQTFQLFQGLSNNRFILQPCIRVFLLFGLLNLLACRSDVDCHLRDRHCPQPAIFADELAIFTLNKTLLQSYIRIANLCSLTWVHKSYCMTSEQSLRWDASVLCLSSYLRKFNAKGAGSYCEVCFFLDLVNLACYLLQCYSPTTPTTPMILKASWSTNSSHYSSTTLSSSPISTSAPTLKTFSTVSSSMTFPSSPPISSVIPQRFVLFLGSFISYTQLRHII